MKIMSEFRVSGSFSEFYSMDFNDDIVMPGHDGKACRSFRYSGYEGLLRM